MGALFSPCSKISGKFPGHLFGQNTQLPKKIIMPVQNPSCPGMGRGNAQQQNCHNSYADWHLSCTGHKKYALSCAKIDSFHCRTRWGLKIKR